MIFFFEIKHKAETTVYRIVCNSDLFIHKSDHLFGLNIWAWPIKVCQLIECLIVGLIKNNSV